MLDDIDGDVDDDRTHRTTPKEDEVKAKAKAIENEKSGAVENREVPPEEKTTRRTSTDLHAQNPSRASVDRHQPSGAGTSPQ